MRVKRGTTRARERTRLLRRTKGFELGRKNLVRRAKTAVLKAGVHAYVHRRTKKRVARRGWQLQVNAAVRPYGLSYSRFMGMLKKQHVALNRKVLADIAEHAPDVFRAVVEKAKRG